MHSIYTSRRQQQRFELLPQDADASVSSSKNNWSKSDRCQTDKAAPCSYWVQINNVPLCDGMQLTVVLTTQLGRPSDTSCKCQ